MANHKHRRPRAQRAGCKMCKYWKSGGNHKQYQKLDQLRYQDAKRADERSSEAA